MNEVWIPIKGYEEFYEVSNMGRVRSLDRLITKNELKYLRHGKVLKEGIDTAGYSFVMLQKNKAKKCCRVHRLVAEAFIVNENNKPQVNHIDGNKQNNNLSNLEYCTSCENVRHAFSTGLMKTKPVLMLDKDTQEVLARFNSIAEANNFLGKGKNGNIGNCLHGRSKTADGYIWRYENEIHN